VSSLILSQSKYPLQTIIKGDSVVILTKAQAQNVNDIFEAQKIKLAKCKTEIAYKDSLLLVNKKVIESYDFNKYVTQRLDILETWILDAAIKNVWLYYSWKDSVIYAVDLSQYYVRKEDDTGDILFYRSEQPLDPEKDKEEPPKGWQNAIIETRRPSIKIVPIKM
jgi:hypothetical protein